MDAHAKTVGGAVKNIENVYQNIGEKNVNSMKCRKNKSINVHISNGVEF